MISDLLGNDRIGYELDEIVYGVNGRMYALETLDLLADGQRVVGEGRRVAVVVRRAAVHCRVTLRAHHTGEGLLRRWATLEISPKAERAGRKISAPDRTTPPRDDRSRRDDKTNTGRVGPETNTREQNSLRLNAVQNDLARLRTLDATTRPAAM